MRKSLNLVHIELSCNNKQVQNTNILQWIPDIRTAEVHMGINPKLWQEHRSQHIVSYIIGAQTTTLGWQNTLCPVHTKSHEVTHQIGGDLDLQRNYRWLIKSDMWVDLLTAWTKWLQGQNGCNILQHLWARIYMFIKSLRSLWLCGI